MMKILIIDDEPLVRRSLEKVFQKAGHDVSTAADGTTGAEMWQKLKPDGVVIDILMPGLTGPEVIAEVKPPHQTAIVLISAFSGEYNPEAIKNLGADLFIEKPFEDIQKIVTSVISIWEMKQS